MLQAPQQSNEDESDSAYKRIISFKHPGDGEFVPFVPGKESDDEDASSPGPPDSSAGKAEDTDVPATGDNNQMESGMEVAQERPAKQQKFNVRPGASSSTEQPTKKSKAAINRKKQCTK